MPTDVAPKRIITAAALDAVSCVANIPGETIAQPVNKLTRTVYVTPEPKGPRQPRRWHTLEDDPREIVACVAVANVVDTNGDLFTRAALSMAVQDACERGLTNIRLDMNHRDPALPVTEVFWKALYMGVAIGSPDCMYAHLGCPTPSTYWDVVAAGLDSGWSCVFRYSLVSDDSAR